MKTLKRHWIYLIQGENSRRIKIGRSECPNLRLRTIQHQCTEIMKIIALVDLGEMVEADAQCKELELQTRFRASHAFGEVFNESPELVSFVAECSGIHKCGACPNAETMGNPWNRHRANKGKVWKDGKLLKVERMEKTDWPPEFNTNMLVM